jgi:hypothetical protein
VQPTHQTSATSPNYNVRNTAANLAQHIINNTIGWLKYEHIKILGFFGELAKDRIMAMKVITRVDVCVGFKQLYREDCLLQFLSADRFIPCCSLKTTQTTKDLA